LTQQLKKIRWASARLFFIIYIGFSVISLVGGFLTAPLMTWYFYGDWRFWRYLSSAPRLFTHALKLFRLMLRDNQGFMFNVPLSSEPRSTPDPSSTSLQPFWPHGRSCGDCSNCCRAGGYACPMLDEEKELCRGYDSFYWRYFNCGRFPSNSAQIDYYDCRKWSVGPVQPIKLPAGVISFSRQGQVVGEVHCEDVKEQEVSTGRGFNNEPIPFRTANQPQNPR
jgi:hypothetical protein